MKSVHRTTLLVILAGPLILMALCLQAHASDQAIERYKGEVVDAVCGDGGVWMEQFKVPQAKCREVSSALVTPCMERALKGRSIPLTKEEDARHFSSELFDCIKGSFLATHGVRSTPSAQ